MTNTYKYVLVGIVLIAVVFTLLPTRTVVQVSDIKAETGLIGPPRVTAIFHNSAAAVDIGYWIETDATKTRHCPGRTRLGEGERRTITFECPALANHSGQFTLRTGEVE